MQRFHPKGVILVAEDEKDLRQLVAEILSEAGYSVLGAADGKIALRVARKHDGPIDLLITDVMMPKLDGFDLREKILLERRQLKVLVMSGALDPEILGEDFPLIRKPFKPHELVHEVDRVLHRPSYAAVV